MTYSCILSRGNDKIVRITFERGSSFAEGIVPDGKIVKQKGFTGEEIEQLEKYLVINRTDIFTEAKKITGIMHWFSDKK